jgi:hypothetical protein
LRNNFQKKSARKHLFHCGRFSGRALLNSAAVDTRSKLGIRLYARHHPGNAAGHRRRGDPVGETAGIRPDMPVTSRWPRASAVRPRDPASGDWHRTEPKASPATFLRAGRGFVNGRLDGRETGRAALDGAPVPLQPAPR